MTPNSKTSLFKILGKSQQLRGNSRGWACRLYCIHAWPHLLSLDHGFLLCERGGGEGFRCWGQVKHIRIPDTGETLFACEALYLLSLQDFLCIAGCLFVWLFSVLLFFGVLLLKKKKKKKIMRLIWLLGAEGEGTSENANIWTPPGLIQGG